MPRQIVDVVEPVCMSDFPFSFKPSDQVKKSTVIEWSISQGYGGALISGKEYHSTFRLICFSKEHVEHHMVETNELKAIHCDQAAAIYRWGRSKGYYAAWANFRSNKTQCGVLCLKDVKDLDGKSVLKTMDAMNTDVDASPDPFRSDKILRWAQDQGYAVGIHNGERLADRAGVVLIPRII